MGNGVRRLDGGNDSLQPAGILECLHSLFIRDRHILGAPDVMQMRMLRTDPRIIQSGGDRIDRGDLAVFILAEQALHPVEDPQAARADGRRRLEGVNSTAGCLAADQGDIAVIYVMIERSDRVGPTSDAGEHCIRKPAFLLQNLRSGFSGDDGLEVPDDGRERMGPHDRSQAVMGV